MRSNTVFFKAQKLFWNQFIIFTVDCSARRLDLDSWINDPPSSSESEAEEDSQTDFQHNTNEAFYPSNESVKKRPELTEEQKYEVTVWDYFVPSKLYFHE